jgi:succinate dehydrogenase / fumarate reductase, cytochrome b subunit
MTSAPHERSARRFVRWFDPHWHDIGTWAFILNRLSGIGLTVYLFLHLIVLGTLARGPQAYDSFVALAKSPVFVLGELLVVVGGLYHGLNGLRVVLNSFGIGVAQQKWLFYAVLALVGVAGAIFAARMLG